MACRFYRVYLWVFFSEFFEFIIAYPGSLAYLISRASTAMASLINR
jgi:hypothetical protein